MHVENSDPAPPSSHVPSSLYETWKPKRVYTKQKFSHRRREGGPGGGGGGGDGGGGAGEGGGDGGEGGGDGGGDGEGGGGGGDGDGCGKHTHASTPPGGPGGGGEGGGEILPKKGNKTYTVVSVCVCMRVVRGLRALSMWVGRGCVYVCRSRRSERGTPIQKTADRRLQSQ